jgi:hypothetical protein
VKATTNVSGHEGWRAKALDWLFSQGVSTVLLFTVIGGVYRGVPQWIDQQTQATNLQNKQFSEALKVQQETADRILNTQRETSAALLTQQREDNARAMTTMVDSFTRAVDRLTDRVEGNKGG